mgnify:FL=1|tara:strand:- start:53 stop:1006 length:954 start_codon:yes stop_codon:yes gene_type:complete
MARTIKLKESDLTKIVRRIANSKTHLFEEEKDKKRRKWFVKAIIDIITTIGAASDGRLKKNIKKVGKSPSGIPIYEFEYKNKARFGGGTYRGVLAEHTPKKAVVLHENGYKVVDYGLIDVAFEKVRPTKGNKKIKLSERDLTNVIKKVLNEKLYEPLDDRMGGPGGTFPDNPFDDDGFGGFGGMSQGGGSNDPMARGNEEMEFDADMNSDRPDGMMMSPDEQKRMGAKIMGASEELAALETEIASHPQSREIPWAMEALSLIRKAGQELSMGNLSRNTIDEINTAKKRSWWKKLIAWIDNLLHECNCAGGGWGPCPC